MHTAYLPSMAVRAPLVLLAISLWPCLEAARLISSYEADALIDYTINETLLACQRRSGARNVWSWFEPETGKKKNIHDGTEIIYRGEVDSNFINVTWNGEPGKMLKANTKRLADGCKPKPSPTSPTTSPIHEEPHDGPTGGDQKYLVIAKYHDASRGWKTTFTPTDPNVSSPDSSGITNGQVMQCLDQPCHLDGSRRPTTVLFRGVEGTVERRNLVWAKKEDYEDFYNPDILMGPCGARLGRPSPEEMELVAKLFTIHDPDSLGKGADVTDGRPPDYNTLKIRSVWKVLNRSPKIKAYTELVAQMNENYTGQVFPLDTLYDNAEMFPPNGLNKPSREKGWLEENEYWMVRGADPRYSESLVCEGGAWATKGLFAHGIYLADAADKMDQYVSPVDKGAAGLEWALNSNKDPQVEEAAARGTKSVGMEPMDVYVGGIMRAYMGHHVELQLKRGKHAFWRDPVVDGEERDKVTGSSERTPPFGDTKFDSMKIVCADTRHTAKHPGCDKRGGGQGNYPYRWNEYVVPGPDGFNPKKRDGFSFAETAVLKYLVVYDRVQE